MDWTRRMSSGYKIKGHQRSRSAKPYERKTGLVNRVKEWLTPSSWLSSWNKGSNDATMPTQLEQKQRLGPPENQELSSASHSASPLFVPKPGALRNPFLSNPMALLGVHGSQPGLSGVTKTLGEAPPTSVGVMGSQNGSPDSTSSTIHSEAGMESRLRSLVSVPLSLRSSGVPSEPLSMVNAREDLKMTDASSSKDSEGSWVAEDDGSMEQEKDNVLDDERGQSSEQSRTKSFPTSLDLSGETERTEVYTYELGEGSAGVVQPATCVTPVVTQAEQVIMQVENPAAITTPPPPSSSFSHTTPAVAFTTESNRTMPSSSLLNRLYTTNPFTMSTPQLSPVHETRENDVHQEVAPKLPVSHSGSDGSSSSRFHSQAFILSAATAESSLLLPAMSTPSKFHTEESLKRSPFRSPFYSGRTSFGGAASGQKPRVKRPRTESSPPVVTPLRLSVTARPVSSSDSRGHHSLVASQTARKIMESLGNLSSPLANARKLPMRATPLLGEAQLAKRRRVSLDAGMASSGNSVLSPPPITPLRTPSQPSHSNMETQIVPSEKSTRPRQHQPPTVTSRIAEDSGRMDPGPSIATKVIAPPPPPPPTLSSLSSSSFPTLSSNNKPIFTVPDFSSTQPPKPSAILSGLTFTAPPILMKPADRMEEQERNRSPPPDSYSDPVPQTFLSQSKRNLGSGGGKMRTKHRRRGAPEEEGYEDEEDVGYVNPMAQPPAVGLTLGKGGTLPKFLFHTQLATIKPQDMASATQASTSSLAAPASLSTNITLTPSFAFSSPKSVVSESGPVPPAAERPLKQAATFDFSAPKDHRHTPTPPPPSSSSLTSKPLPTTFKPSVPPTLNSLLKPSPFPPSSGLNAMNRLKEQPKGVQPSPPPLKAMSVEEALRSPDFQLPLSKAAAKPPTVTKPAKEEDVVCIDLTDSDDEKDSEPKPAVAAKASLGSSGLQLGSSGGLQLGTPSGGLKLGTPGGLQLGSSSASTGMSTISGAGSVLPVKLGAPVSSSGPSTNLKLKTDSTSSVPPLKPLSQFAPPSGSWECDQCLVRNQAKDDKCVACSAPKPSSQKTDTMKPTILSFKPLSQFAPPSGSWECNQCMVRNQAKDDKCVACTAPKPASKATTNSKSTAPPVFKPLMQFAPPAGSWECDQCMVNNKAAEGACVACGTTRPVKNDSKSASGVSKPSVTLSLGAAVKQSVGSWSCEVCLVQNKAEDNKCIACTAPKPGGKTILHDTPSTSSTAKWTCNTCLVVNKAEDVKCVACSSPRVAKLSPPSLSSDPKSQKSPSRASSITPLTGFAPPVGSWTCDTCLVQNNAGDTKCVSCSTPKPGAKAVLESDSGSKTGPSSGLTIGNSGGLKLGGGLVLGSFGQGGLKLLGSGGNESQDTSAVASSGGVKITASLSSLAQSKAPGPKQSSSGGLIGLSSTTGSAPTSSSSQASIPQLAEKNPLAGIKFGVTATSTTATSQNPLAGIKFGAPATTTSMATTTAPLQINFGATSTSSSPFKLGSAVGGVTVGEQTGGLKIGGTLLSGPSSTMDTQPSGGTQGAAMLSGVQPIGGAPAANPLAGLKFGVPTTQPSSSSSGSTKLQFPSQSQLQFGISSGSTASSLGLFGLSSSTTTTTSSQSVTTNSGNVLSPFIFSGATKPESNNNKPVMLQFGASLATQSTAQGSQLQPPVLNSVLNSTTSASASTSSSLFMFSGSKDVSKIDSSSPFPNTGSASSSLGGFGTTGVIGMGTGSGTGLGGGAQPLKLNFGSSQLPSNQPFVFGGSNSGSGSNSGGSLFGKQEPATQSQGMSLTGQQPVPGLTLPQTQGSIFGAQTNQQPQLNFGSTTQPPPPSTFNFSAGSSASSAASSSGLGIGGATPNLGFPSSNMGGLNFGVLPTTSLGAGVGQTQANSSDNGNKQQQGFQFNPNAGISFNFGSSQMAPVGSGDNVFFSAGGSQGSAPPTARVVKKARRRVK